MLYQAVTGQVPFPRDTERGQDVGAHGRAAAARHGGRAAGSRPQFDEVIARAMAKRPDDRYLSAGDLGRAALAAAQGQLLTRAERSVATGEAAPDQASPVAGTGATAAAVPQGATRVDTPAPGTPPGAMPPPGAPAGAMPPPGAPPGATPPPPGAPPVAPGAPPGEPSGWRAPVKKRRSRLPLIIAAAVAGVAAIIAVLVIALSGGGGNGGGGGGGGSKPPAGVWVITGETSVSRLNPKTGEVTATIRNVGTKLVGIAAGQGAVWALDETAKRVVRIDPGGNRVSARIPIGGEFTPNAIAAGKEGVFVASGPSLIVRIDPATNRISQREDSEGAYDLATGAGLPVGHELPRRRRQARHSGGDGGDHGDQRPRQGAALRVGGSEWGVGAQLRRHDDAPHPAERRRAAHRAQVPHPDHGVPRRPRGRRGRRVGHRGQHAVAL